jgi:hypothetical protein
MNFNLLKFSQRTGKTFRIKLLLIILCFSSSLIVSGKGYYVNSLSGLDANAGTSAGTPWKTLDKAQTAPLQPGDTLFFSRGSSFTGGIEITASGTSDKPIVLTSCGKGNVPKFSNPDRTILKGNAIRLSGSYLVVDGLYFHDCAPAPDKDAGYTDIWDVGAVRIVLGANHCTVKNCEFNNCPKGIQSTGEYSLITKNYLHNANSRPLSSPGWGPIGIHMGNSHQEVSYNIIKDYYFIGGEFGADGGALELDDGRNPKKDIYIHHNYTSSNMGFLEVSWFADIAKTETYDLRIAYNVSDDYQDFVMLWAPTHDTYIENNTVFRQKQVKNAIVPAVYLIDYNGVTIRNNLVAVDSTTQVFTGKGVQDHSYNMYWSIDHGTPNIGVPLTPTEKTIIDPKFSKKRKSESDYSLRRKSPAIDAGTNLNGKYTVDFVGHRVPSGKSADIGAFEFKGK